MNKEITRFIKWELASRDTIDVKRCYIDIAGDLIAGILLSQIIYWFMPNEQGKSKLRVVKDGQLCLAKNRKDWSKECCISEKQYDRAIKILKKKSFVSVRNSMFGGNKCPHIFLKWDSIIRALKIEI